MILQKELAEASFNGDLKSVRTLIKRGANPDSPDERGYRPLFMACQEGRLKVARFLIQSGADVNCHDEDGETPLSYAVGAGHPKLVSLLLKHGAEINNQSEHSEGGTSLHLAAAWNRLRIARILIRAGGLANVRDKKGRTPIFFAKKMKHRQMVKLLEQTCHNTENGSAVPISSRQ